MSDRPTMGDAVVEDLGERISRVNVTTQKEPCHTVKTRTTVKTILCALALAAVAHGQQIPPLAPPRAGFSFPAEADPHLFRGLARLSRRNRRAAL